MYVQIIGGLVAVVGAFAFGYASGSDSVTAKWTQDRFEIQELHNQQLKAFIEKEQQLNDEMDKLRKRYANENAAIRDRLNASLVGVQSHPKERASTSTGLPEGSRVGVGCTGKGLAKPDAEFLAGYSADAARLQAALNQCVSQYNALRSK